MSILDNRILLNNLLEQASSLPDVGSGGSGSIPTPDAIETCSLTINSNRPEMPISVHYTGINDNTLSLESVLFTDSTKTITCVKNTVVSVMFQAYDDYFNYLVEETGDIENAGQFGDLYCYSVSGNGTISFNASELND